jgi:hypothetical protein
MKIPSTFLALYILRSKKEYRQENSIQEIPDVAGNATNGNSESPKVETGNATSLTTETVADPISTSKEYSLYQMSIANSNAIRPAPITFSLKVTPIKVTSSVAVMPSSIYATCGDQVLAHSDFSMPSKPKRGDVIYQPSLILAPELVCSSEIKIEMTIMGYEVELSNVSIGAVTETSVPTAAN